MQKLLRRSPPPSPLFSPPANAFSFSSPHRRPKPSASAAAGCFPYLPLNNIIRSLVMPSTAAAPFNLRPCVPLSADAHSSGRVAVSGSFRFRRCSVTDGATAVRPWVGAKENRSGVRLPWLHTVAAAGAEGDALDFSADDSKSEDKPLKFHRRQRGNLENGVSSVSPRSPDLLAIPGVGPRNLRKLVDNGIEGVAELKQIYRDRFLGDSSHKMVKYLQSDVGIVHRNHAESITTFIKESVDEELKDDGSSSDVKPHKKRITLCVEGNISVGKTTFLQRIANETLELRDLVEVVPEPIDKWQNVGGGHFNILDAFYAEPERYAYTFQNYVFVTRVMQERATSGGIRPLRLMERSVFTDRMVFVRAVHEAKWMNEMEISIYDSWFDPVVSSLPGLIPDGFIYLRASPDTCHKRMMIRKREEEGGVSLDYLRDLHEKHESWLLPSESGNHELLTVNQLPRSLDSPLYPSIRDRVFLLEGSNMHPSIQKVPALVLDCEPNIDFSRDIEAKQHYARQVAEFFEFVKKKKLEMELASPRAQDGSGKNTRQPIYPHQSRLWSPDGKNLQDLPFQPMDFGLSMPSFLPVSNSKGLCSESS